MHEFEQIFIKRAQVFLLQRLEARARARLLFALRARLIRLLLREIAVTQIQLLALDIVHSQSIQIKKQSVAHHALVQQKPVRQHMLDKQVDLVHVLLVYFVAVVDQAWVIILKN